MKENKYFNKLGIVERDIIINKLNEKIGELTDRKKTRTEEIKYKKKDNQLLNTVLQKYENQNLLISKIKERQMNQIEQLLDYIEDSIKKNSLSDTQLKNINHERDLLIKDLTNITHEFKDISKEIDLFDE